MAAHRRLRQMPRRPARGSVVYVLLAVLVASAAGLGLKALSSRLAQQRSDTLSAQVLAQARDALAGEFTRRQRGSGAPYGLPCPDRVGNDGLADPPCNTAATSVGRLPWRTLGLGDLRDASGERLWYVVTPAWGNALAPIGAASAAGLTVSLASGAALHPAGLGANAAVALVIAPGAPLQRLGAGAVQARPSDLPVDHLDRCAAPECALTQDNADTDGGYVVPLAATLDDAAGQTRLNDQMIVLTRGELCHVRRTGATNPC